MDLALGQALLPNISAGSALTLRPPRARPVSLPGDDDVTRELCSRYRARYASVGDKVTGISIYLRAKASPSSLL